MAAYQAPPSLGFSNTGVGCHFLLQCMKVKSESEVAQSCPNLCDPMDCSLPGSSIHEIFQARVLELGAIAFSKGLSTKQKSLSNILLLLCWSTLPFLAFLPCFAHVFQEAWNYVGDFCWFLSLSFVCVVCCSGNQFQYYYSTHLPTDLN